MGDCKHDYQLETVGGVYLTGAYVCRLCSYRMGMSREQFHQQAAYPGHYQADESAVETLEARAHHARELYRQRLNEQLRELTRENLPSMLSEEERNEILLDVIQDALLEVVEACQVVATNSGLSEGKSVAELIERKIGSRTKVNHSSPITTPPTCSQRDS